MKRKGRMHLSELPQKDSNLGNIEKRRSGSSSSFTGARRFLPAPQTGSLRPVDMRPAAFLSLRGPVELKGEIIHARHHRRYR
jgi:hypothetical protein